jgi:hypothetical protein
MHGSRFLEVDLVAICRTAERRSGLPPSSVERISVLFLRVSILLFVGADLALRYFAGGEQVSSVVIGQFIMAIAVSLVALADLGRSATLLARGDPM